MIRFMTGHWLVVLVGLGLLYVLSTVAVVLIAVELQSTPFEPLVYKSPQHVLNPIVHPGDALIVEAYKCNQYADPVTVSATPGSPYVRNLATQEIIPRPGARLDVYVREPGCPLLHFKNPLPELGPGRYVLEGTEIATRGTDIQREAWGTEPFCVTDSQGKGC